jgi:hypothetical protein
MPRNNEKHQSIKWMETYVARLKKHATYRELLDDDDSFEDCYDSLKIRKLKRMKASRYMYRKAKYRRRKKFDLFDCLLEEGSEGFNDTEFLQSFRMTRESFYLLVEEMSTKKAFKKAKFRPRRCVAYQLLVFLYRLGKEGTGGCSIAVSQFFGIGIGSVNNYVERSIRALMEIKEEVVYWPDEGEREEIKTRMAVHGFRHCVGIIDGTLVVLDFRPEIYHECYYSRKCCYALNVMVVCDDQRRITYYYAGWPGSTHDNRVFRNSKLFKKREDYFSHMEYLLGDAAYSNSTIMVQAFKKHCHAAYLPRDEHNFNTALAQQRIVSEHCIGILKGRFGCIKRSNIHFKKGKKEVKELIDIIGACIILHNLLIGYNETDIPKDWYDTMRDEIDWSGYDEEDFHHANVEEDGGNRREMVFNSIINNYYI